MTDTTSQAGPGRRARTGMTTRTWRRGWTAWTPATGGSGFWTPSGSGGDAADAGRHGPRAAGDPRPGCPRRQPEPAGRVRQHRFRDPDPANLLSARLELLCAANLAFRHVPFEIGGKAEPDVTWNPGTGAQGWLEIHRGAFSVFDDFQQALDKELAAKGAILTVRLGEWPLDVRDRNLLHTRISNAIDAAVASARPSRRDARAWRWRDRGHRAPAGDARNRQDLRPAPRDHAVRGLPGQCRRPAGAEGQRGQGRAGPERQVGRCPDGPAGRHLNRPPGSAPRPGRPLRLARRCAG